MMSSSIKPVATPKQRSVSNAGQACRECRRRKGKCDSRLPVCSVCTRYNRHCLYDKHSRSALTRKHLTEVEERLERAEAVLRTLFTEKELSQVLTNGMNIKDSTVGTDLGAQPTASDTRSSSEVEEGNVPLWQPKLEPGLFTPTSSSSVFPDNASVLKESLPSAADDDFEWDERISYDPQGTFASPQSTEDALLPRVTDGMATLTTDDSNTGFLGSVSGAALLRLISENKERAGEAPYGSASGDDRIDSLADFLALRPTDSVSSESFLKAQPLITRAFVDALVDSYFAHYHPSFPILHEASFREQYQTLGGRPKGTWHILAQLVAALGSFVSSTCSDDTDISLFNAVKSQLTIESLEAGSIGLVQAFALSANYLQKRNRPNSGYNYGGVALRLAISLGLHKEFPAWQTMPLRKEIRRRVWWSLCVLDVGATISYGRPLNWPIAGVEARLPLNIHDQELTTASTSMPTESHTPSIYSYVRTQSSYHLCTIAIYNRLISAPLPSAAELIALDDEHIEGWRNNLPLYYSDDDLPLSNEYLLAHALGRWRFRMMRIIMYRPYLLRWAQDGLKPLHNRASSATESNASSTSAEDLATIRCFQAAEECISILYQFWCTAHHTRLAAWYVCYFLLHAVLIPVHCLRRDPSHPQASGWITQIRTTLDIINAMVNINPSAPKCRDIIHRLCGESLGLSATTGSQNLGEFASDANAEYYFSNTAPPDLNNDLWMTEIDTAIDGYEVYCDRLTNAAMPGIGGTAGCATGGQGSVNNAGELDPSNWFDNGNGIHDWDWGLML